MTLDRGELLWRLSTALGTAALGGSFPAAAEAGPAESGGDRFSAHPRWKFVFISHLTTSPLFVPLQYGIQDACALVRCDYRWTGSPRGDTGEVVKALQSAVKSKADGIAVSLVDPDALAGPLSEARRKAIPVVAFHADASPSDRTVAFVGQSSYATGLDVGQRIAGLVRSGDVALFVAERGAAPVEGRLKGTLGGIARSGLPIRASVVVTTLDPYESAARIDRYVTEHTRLRGLFALELVSSEGVGRAVAKHALDRKGIRAGGYGVLPATLELIKSGKLAFTLDEQPYLQGFVPALQLFLSKISGGLVGPADTVLPLVFVTKGNLRAYLAKTRYEGSSSKQRYPIF
jgi:simple sugar transport system substrate-binding protein